MSDLNDDLPYRPVRLRARVNANTREGLSEALRMILKQLEDDPVEGGGGDGSLGFSYWFATAEDEPDDAFYPDLPSEN